MSDSIRSPSSPREDSAEDVYSDLYSTFSQMTTTTVNDIEQRPYPFTLKTCVMFLSSTIGGLLFGYDTGVISGVLIAMNPSDIRLSRLENWQREVITSITCAGSFVGSILAFPLADSCGRKNTLTVCCVIFAMASMIMASSFTLGMLISGRFVVGIAVGIAAQCIPIYLSEISPAKIRGTMLTLNSISITGGQFFAYLIAYWMIDAKNPTGNSAWRYLFALGALPAIVFLLTLDCIPESPRWLLSKARLIEAESALQTIYSTATANEIHLKMKKMANDLNKVRYYSDETEPLILPGRKRRSVASSRTARSSVIGVPYTNQQVGKKIHRWESKSKRALLIASVLMFFQQLSGFNAFMYYSATIFEQVGFENPLVPAIVVAFTNFCFTIFAIRLIDTIGRRMMLLSTIWIMTIGLLLCSVGFELKTYSLLIVSVIVYVAAYATGMGIVPWSSVEFLPLNRRAIGGSVISCTNWFTNSVVSLTYLTVMDKIGSENTMLIFALFTVFNWLFVFIWYPEVKGLSLEEVGQVFENGVDVHFIYRNYH